MELNAGDVDIIRVAAAITIIVGALYALGKIIRSTGKFIRRVLHALDLIIGVPAIGDTPERPGILSRVTKIEAEIQPNHGTSMRDAVDVAKASIARVEDAVRRLERALTHHVDEHHATHNRNDNEEE